jgi:hypothetical protein
MKMKESVFEPASFLKKEMLRIDFSDVTKRDIPEFYNALVKILRDRRGKTLWISIDGPDFMFKNEEEFNTFISGFSIAMRIMDPDVLDAVGRAKWSR